MIKKNIVIHCNWKYEHKNWSVHQRFKRYSFQTFQLKWPWEWYWKYIRHLLSHRSHGCTTPLSRRSFGGKLICFCMDQTKSYTNPAEVTCAHYSGDMLDQWIRKYKMIGRKGDCASLRNTNYEADLSTPHGLASHYKYLIDIFGFRTAAYALEEAKQDR